MPLLFCNAGSDYSIALSLALLVKNTLEHNRIDKCTIGEIFIELFPAAGGRFKRLTMSTS